jgi:hypothetical protein
MKVTWGLQGMLRMKKDLVSGKFVVLFFRIVVSPLVYTPVCFTAAKSKDDVMLSSLFPLQAIGRYNVPRMEFPRREKDVFSNKR